MRILITGSRNWTNRDVISLALRPLFDRNRTAVLVHGNCPSGADYIADQIWRSIGGTVEPHPAMWALHGKAAGPLRNQEMVDLGADVCLAFPLADSRGTHDCMRRAAKAGIPVINYQEEWHDDQRNN